jgi:hypothetical protein
VKKIAIALSVAALAVVGCSGDDSTDTATGGTTADGASTATTEPMGPCPSETSLTVTGNADYAGPFDVEWGLADDGPGFLNGDDNSMDLAFASFDIPESDQFGIEIPTAGPDDPPEDGLYMSVSLQKIDGVIGADQTFIDQLLYDEAPETADGEINFIVVQQGTERLLLDDIEVTLTELSEQTVCGTITSSDTSDIQDLSGVEGEFVVDRIEYLDGEEYDDDTMSTDDTTDDTMSTDDTTDDTTAER